MATATAQRTKVETRSHKKLKWSVPRWSTAREMKKVAPLVFAAGPVLRIIGVSLVVGAVICIAVKIVFPQMPLGFLWKALIAFPAMYGYLGLYFAIRLLIPAQVKITKKQICYSTGESAWVAKLLDIESSKLVVYSSEHLHLIIRVRGKLRKLAVAPETDLHLLMSILSSTIVIDKRREFTASRAFVATAKSVKIES